MRVPIYMTFQEQFDPRELIDPTVSYLVRLDRVEDRQTQLGDALQWTFTVFERDSHNPVRKPDDKQLVVSRITSPSAGPRSRTRRFIHALFGRSLSKDELGTMIQQRTLASQLKDREALAFFEFDDREDTTFLRINELLPVDAGKPGKPALEKPKREPREYSDVFDDEPAEPPPSGKRGKKTPDSSSKDLPF